MSKPTMAERLEVAEQDAAAFFYDATNLQKRLAEAEEALKNIRHNTQWNEGEDDDGPYTGWFEQRLDNCYQIARGYLDKHKKG